MASTEKLAKLKELLSSALTQLRQKLAVVRKHIGNLQTIGQVDQNIKLVCNLLIEIQELLRDFPAIHEIEPTELDNQAPPGSDQLVDFKRSVLIMVGNIESRLLAVEEFIGTSDSLPQVTTVAVTVRDITKYLKIVSVKGKRLINTSAKVDSIPRTQISTVSGIVSYYSELNTPQLQRTASNGRPASVNASATMTTTSSSSEAPDAATTTTTTTSSSTSSSPPSSSSLLNACSGSWRSSIKPSPDKRGSFNIDSPTMPPKSASNNTASSTSTTSSTATISSTSTSTTNSSDACTSDRSTYTNEESIEDSTDDGDELPVEAPSRPSIRLNDDQKSAMERALTKRMTTIHKTHAEMFNQMMESTTVEEMALFETQVAPPAPLRPALSLTPESNRVWRSGSLRKQYKGVFGNSWKQHWWILEGNKLVVSQDQLSRVALRAYDLETMTGVSFKETRGALDYNSATIHLNAKSDRKLNLMSADGDSNLINWIIAIDSIQSYLKLDATILHPMDKHRLLQLQWKRNHKGGEIKSSYDEEWTYSASGSLKSSMGVEPPLAYRWDGEMLIGIDEVSTSFGSGKWNGVSMVWFDEAANGLIGNPSMRYHWNEQDREYTSEQEAAQVWKWTRHFLASKFGAGEWIVEGDVPEPVVMFLQLMRTSRLARSMSLILPK